KPVVTAIRGLSQEQIKELEQGRPVTLNVEGQEVAIQPDEVIITAKEIKGWKIASDGAVTVALDVTLTPELEREGWARELVNRLQNLRKSSGLEVTDRISVYLPDEETLKSNLADTAEYVKREILAENLIFDDEKAREGEEIEVNGTTFAVKIEKV
ncbi:MAG: isoleucine--tRNA ligase, partial [Chlorobi bacterium]|nr:isoleucine--tRNA ligase [Chlorobiota bacterium]